MLKKYFSKISDYIFIMIFSNFIDLKKSQFDKDYFQNYIYYSELYGKWSELNFKLFYKKKPYIGRYLYSNQWGNKNKKNTFIKIIKKFAIDERRINFLEIGSYAGSSLITACNTFKKLKKKFNCIAIDLHDKIYNKSDISKSNIYRKIEEYSKSKKVKKLFEHNIKYSQFNVKYFQTNIDGFISKTQLLKDDKINIFYIDAGHMYYNIINDIKKCLKIALIQKTDNFLIFGDDYGLPYYKVKKEYTQEYLYKDTIRSKITGTTFHPGVTKAVHDVFGNVEHENGLWYKYINTKKE